MRLSTSKSNFTENIFKNQKQNIQKQKIINNMEISSSPYPSPSYITNGLNFIIFKDLNEQWLYSAFNTEVIVGEETPIIESSQWSSTDLTTASSYELRNLIIKSKQRIDYRIVSYS